MALDFARAWELARAAPLDAHHPECSYVKASGALLCDLGCPVIADAPEFLCPAMHGAGGIVLDELPPHYVECSGHESAPDSSAISSGS